MRKTIALLVVLALVLGVSSVAFATGASNNCNGNGSCSQDTNNDFTANGGSATATGGSATAFGGNSEATAVGVGVGIGVGGRGGNANVDNNVRNTNTVNSRNSNRNSNTNVAVNGQEQSASANQSQSADNQGVSQEVKTKVYSYGHSAPSATAGSDAFSIGTFLGGIGVAGTETYVKVQAEIEELNSMHSEKLLSDDEYRTRKLETLGRLDRATRNRGRHLLNLFGLL